MGNRVFWISNHSVRLRALKSSFNANHWINSSLNAFMEGLCLGSLSVDLCNKSSRGIINILSIIAGRKSLNHMFYPSGGGMDLKGVEQAGESGAISLLVGPQSAEILKPKKLCYESFGFYTKVLRHQ